MRRLAVVVALLLAAPATAQAENPLTGEGTGFKLIANLPIDPSDVAASDIELHGNYAFIGSYSEGLVIADISDPTHPKRAGTFDCGGGSQYDVQLSEDANLVLLTTDATGAKCLGPEESGSMVIDATDRSNPKLVSFIPTAVGSHTHTLDNRTLYINNYPAAYSKLEIYDLTDPAKPAKVSELSFDGEDSIHDSYVDHRPDGRTLLYAASIGFTDVIDVTNPAKPMILQRLADPKVSISHQAEPNAARDTLIVTDEFAGGSDAPVCGKGGVQLPGLGVPVFGDPLDLGAIHFYRLDPDGTMTNGGKGAGKYGTFNLPQAPNPSGGCTVHVFWQAPDENRLVTAWYGRGIHVVDFQDPSAPRELAGYTPTGADVWSAKPHRVGGKAYIFTGDIVRGMDVLSYTADNGWPATAPPAEQQRAARTAGVSGPPAPPATPSQPATTVDEGVLFRRKLRVPRRARHPRARRVVTVTFRGATGRVASKLRFRLKPGVRRLRARISGLQAGSYRYTIRLGDRGRVLKRGKVRIAAQAGASNIRPRLVCLLVR